MSSSNWMLSSLISCLVLSIAGALVAFLGEGATISGSLAAIGVVVAAIACALVFSSISRLRALREEVSQLSREGVNFHHRIRAQGDLASMADSLNALIQQVATTVETLSSVSDQVAKASSDLAGSSQEISSSAERQAAQAVEVATAMEEMSSTVQEVARNATEVADQARVGTELAETGASVVRQTIESMETIANSVRKSAATVEELGRRSAEIGQIIGVISDIADQTNLLSLNAAIEAARAGEHGRGFAVVADEVRKLAEKTSHATNEVRDTIGATQAETKEAVDSMRSGNHDVEIGVELASRAEHSLADIVSSYMTVNDMVHQIATAAEQQSATSTEIADHIESIAALSREVRGGIGAIAEAAGELAVISQRMREQVSTMSVPDSGMRTTRRTW